MQAQSCDKRCPFQSMFFCFPCVFLSVSVYCVAFVVSCFVCVVFFLSSGAEKIHMKMHQKTFQKHSETPKSTLQLQATKPPSPPAPPCSSPRGRHRKRACLCLGFAGVHGRWLLARPALRAVSTGGHLSAGAQATVAHCVSNRGGVEAVGGGGTRIIYRIIQGGGYEHGTHLRSSKA